MAATESSWHLILVRPGPNVRQCDLFSCARHLSDRGATPVRSSELVGRPPARFPGTLATLVPIDRHGSQAPPPGRYPFRLSPRWTVVVLEPAPGMVALGIFLDGELSYVLDKPAGEV